MENIYSKIDGRLLHKVIRSSDIADERNNVIVDDQFLQCSVMNLPLGKKFKPHKHIVQHREYDDYIPQESWIVIKGKVKCYFYDIDDQLIQTVVLEPGDASFTLYGGHTYEIMEDGSKVYEYKTGPYLGMDKDKMHIE